MLDFLSIDVGSILFTLLNTLILFLIMKHLLFQPINNIVEQRQKSVDSNLSEAELAKQSANRLKAEYEEKIENAKEESAEIMKKATQKAQIRSDELIAQAKVEAGLIQKHAEAEIEHEKRRAKLELKSEIAGLAVLAAEQVVGKEINADDHARMIADFISEGADHE